MSNGDFWLQSNHGRKISLERLKELNKNQLKGNDVLLKLFNIFDTQKSDGTKGSDGVLNKNELVSLFNAFANVAQSDGDSSILEKEEVENYLSTIKTSSGELLKDVGLNANHVFDFFYLISRPDVTERNIAKNELNKINQQAKNAQKEGMSLADELYDDIDGLGTSSSFDKHVSRINSKNVVETLEAYRRKSPDESFIEAVFDEVGLLWTHKMAVVDRIKNSLLARAKTAGVDATKFKKDFEAELSSQEKSWKPANSKRLDSIVESFIEEIHTAENLKVERLNDIVNDTGMTETRESLTEETVAKSIINNLKEYLNSAKEALKNGTDGIGWTGWVADEISRLWGSNNRMVLVEADIKKFEAQLAKLEDAASGKLFDSNGNRVSFDTVFQQIFGVKFNKNNMISYLQAQENYQLASTQSVIYSQYDTAFSEIVQEEEYSSEGLQKLEQGFEQTCGKNFYDVVLKSVGFDSDSYNRLSDEEKYNLLKSLASELLNTAKSQLDEILAGGSLEELKRKQDSCYKAAFGVDNDIHQRVTEYVSSQHLGSMVTKGATIMGAVLLTVATVGTGSPILMGALATAAASAGVELSDKATNNIDNVQDLSPEQVYEIIKNAVIDGGIYAATAGLMKLFPGANAKNLLAVAKQIGKEAGIDTSVSVLGDFLKTGQITKEGLGMNMLIALLGSSTALGRLNKRTPKSPSPAEPSVQAPPKKTPSATNPKQPRETTTTPPAQTEPSAPPLSSSEPPRKPNDIEGLPPKKKSSDIDDVDYKSVPPSNKEPLSVFDLHKRFNKDLPSYIKENLDSKFEVLQTTKDGWLEVRTTAVDARTQKNYEYRFILTENDVYVLRVEVGAKNSRANTLAWGLDSKTGKMISIHPDKFNSMHEILMNSVGKSRSTDKFKGVDEDLRSGKNPDEIKNDYSDFLKKIDTLNDVSFKAKINAIKNKFLKSQRGALMEDLQELTRTLNGIDPVKDKLVYDKINEILNMVQDNADGQLPDRALQVLFKRAQELSDVVNTAKGNYALKDTKNFIQDIRAYINKVADSIKSKDFIFAKLGKNYEILEYSNDFVKVRVKNNHGYEEHIFDTNGELLASKFETEYRRIGPNANVNVQQQISYKGQKGSINKDAWEMLNERLKYSKKHPESKRSYKPYDNAEYKRVEQKIMNDENLVSLKNTIASSDNLSVAEKKRMYKQYYLDKLATDSRVSKDVIDTLEQIYEKHGVPVFLDKDLNPECVYMIAQELDNWQKASGGVAKFPTIIDTSVINPKYFNTGVVGYVQPARGNMSLRGEYGIVSSLRHELAHLNDDVSGAFGKFGKNQNFDFSENGEILKNKQWYREELKNAGISDSNIDYAYTNKREFVAVAAEGNLQAYSPEFRAVLVELGMPEWMFNLPV